jgi:hypothetical protein
MAHAPSHTGSGEPAHKPWNIVVLYEDRADCRRAVSTLGKILPEHARANGVNTFEWRFSDWEDDGQQQQLVEGIIAADLIVVAPGAEVTIPMEAVEWLGRTLSKCVGRVPTVITVCDPAADANAPGNVSAALLRRIAISANLVVSEESIPALSR